MRKRCSNADITYHLGTHAMSWSESSRRGWSQIETHSVGPEISSYIQRLDVQEHHWITAVYCECPRICARLFSIFPICSPSKNRSFSILHVSLLDHLFIRNILQKVAADGLTLHVGISCGKLCFGILGGIEDYWECLMSGEPIGLVAEALDEAKKRQVPEANSPTAAVPYWLKNYQHTANTFRLCGVLSIARMSSVSRPAGWLIFPSRFLSCVKNDTQLRDDDNDGIMH